MSNYRRAWLPGSTCFFTVALRNRKQSLLVEHIAALRDAFRVARVQRPFALIAAVVLPEHLHCIWRLPRDDSNNGIRWRHIKACFCRAVPEPADRSESRRSRRERSVWQRRYWEHLIRDERDLQAHIDYIHFNPVKHGLVKCAADWPHSSFHRFVARGWLSADWACDQDSDASHLARFGE